MEGEDHLVVGLGHEGELRIPGEAVTRKVIFLSIDGIGVVFHAAHDGEKDGRMTWPILRIGLPKILTPVAVDNTLEFGSHFCDLDGQLFIFQFNHNDVCFSSVNKNSLFCYWIRALRTLPFDERMMTMPLLLAALSILRPCRS